MTADGDLSNIWVLLAHTVFHNNHTLIWVGEMLCIHLVRPQPSLGPEASCTGTRRQGYRIWEPATPTSDAHLRLKSQSTSVYHTSIRWSSTISFAHLLHDFSELHITNKSDMW